MSSATNSVAAQLEGVQQRIRRLYLAVLILLLVVAGILVMELFPNGTVVVRSLSIVDGSGTERALLTSSDGDSLIYLFDKDGHVQVHLGAGINGGVLQLQDHAGRDRVAVAAGGIRPSMMFFDDTGPYVAWKVDRNGHQPVVDTEVP